MQTVFLLWHSHKLTEEMDDEKLIGVYSTEARAAEARERVAEQPGFRDHLEGFEICSYEVDRDNWTEGFVTLRRSE